MEVESNVAASGLDAGNTGDKSDSLNDAISAAIKASDNAEVEAKVSEAPAKDPQAALEETAGDKRAGEDASAAKEPAEAKGEEAKAPTTFEAPKHWPEADKQAFSKLQPEAQEIIRRLAKDLEGGFTRRSQELGDKARYAEAVRGLFDDTTRHQIASSGINELQYIGWLNQCQQFATRDPPGYAKWVMQQLGVRPEDLGIHAPSQQPDPPKQDELSSLFQDPKVNELEARLAQIQGHLSERQQAEQRYWQEQEYARKANIHGTIETFRTALDDHGQLRFPHFDQVRHVMAAKLNDPEVARIADPIERMQAAYQDAVWARPDLRSSLLEQEASKRAADKIKAQEVARAKAVTAIRPASGVVANRATPKSLDDIIRDAMGQHGR
jgi:hypothetical protein